MYQPKGQIAKKFTFRVSGGGVKFFVLVQGDGIYPPPPAGPPCPSMNLRQYEAC